MQSHTLKQPRMVARMQSGRGAIVPVPRRGCGRTAARLWRYRGAVVAVPRCRPLAQIFQANASEFHQRVFPFWDEIRLVLFSDILYSVPKLHVMRCSSSCFSDYCYHLPFSHLSLALATYNCLDIPHLYTPYIIFKPSIPHHTASCLSPLVASQYRVLPCCDSSVRVGKIFEPGWLSSASVGS